MYWQVKTDTQRLVYKQGGIASDSVTQNKLMHVMYVRMYVIHTPKHKFFAYHAGEHNLSTYSRNPLIRALVIRIADYPDRLGPSGKYVENCTRLTCLDLRAIGSSTVQCYGFWNFKSVVVETFRRRYLTHWGREGSFKLFKRPFPGFLIILTL